MIGMLLICQPFFLLVISSNHVYENTRYLYQYHTTRTGTVLSTGRSLNNKFGLRLPREFMCKIRRSILQSWQSMHNFCLNLA